MNYLHEILPGGRNVYLCIESLDKISVGGTRVRKYPSPAAAYADCKRLCASMSYKCAWAELPWYGAKAVIDSEHRDLTEKDWAAYAAILNRLGGHFITATDVGATMSDMEYLRTLTPHVSVMDTAEATAGVLMKCILATSRMCSIPIASVLIHGVGKIGSLVARKLYERGASMIYICDIDKSRCDFFKKLDPLVFHVVSPADIDMSVDYLIPCSIGPLITNDNACDIKASVICGAANCQLESDDVAEVLHERKVLYVPDFIANSGGLLKVAVSEGAAGPIAIECVPKKLEKLLFKSRALRRSPLSLARERCRDRTSLGIGAASNFVV